MTWERARRAADKLTTPLLPDDYLELINPLWSTRELRGRIERIRRSVDHMLLVFPFEEALYREAGVPATYVGHPLADQIPEQVDVAGARQAA